MYKVLIVDDEFFAREGMKQTVDWEYLNCTVCGEADNALRAIELAKEYTPDIIITDIKMPGMNGIDMVKEIKSFLDARIIVITGYDEFEYAKGALKVGAIDLLQKPIDENEFLIAIKKAVNSCNDKRKEKDIVVNQIYSDLLAKRIEYNECSHKLLSNYGLAFDQIVFVKIEDDSYEDYRSKGFDSLLFNYKQDIKEMVEKTIKGRKVILEYEGDRVYIIINSSHFDNIEIINLQKCITKKIGSTISIGISQPCDLCNIRRAYEQSTIALKNRLYTGKNSVNYYQDVSEKSKIQQESISRLKKELFLNIDALDYKNAESKLKSIYFEEFINNKLDIYFINQFTISIAIKSLNLMEEHGISSKGYSEVYEKISTCGTIEEFYNIIVQFVKSTIDEVKEIKSDGEESGITAALQYINDNFCEDIKLSDVAKQAYISESHLSRKFKSTFNIGVNDYIVKLRMEKAVNLMKSGRHKINEVASMVGYGDYRYFSQLFKKHTGYRPSEFGKRD